jgi:hypothetical protein
MGFLDKAKAAAEQATARVKDEADDFQAKRGLKEAYESLGQKTFELLESGAVSHPDLQTHVVEIKGLQARLVSEAAAPGAPPPPPAPAAEPAGVTAPGGAAGAQAPPPPPPVAPQAPPPPPAMPN